MSAQGGFTLAHFSAFAEISLMRESFANSLYVTGMTMFFATLLAVPLAAITAHFELRSPLLIQTLGVLRPCSCCLGARAGQPAAQQRLWGLTAADGGINGVIFIETLHYFSFILLSLAASLANIDP